MLFNSWEFLVLLLITFVLFYSVPNGPLCKAVQSIILLIASTVFYGWEDWTLLGLLAVSCGGNALAATGILACRMRGNERSMKRWVYCAVVLNLLLLGIFKYAALLVGLIPWLPESVTEAVSHIALPIGISFYTFHGISMVVDMSRGKVQAYDQQLLRYGMKGVGVSVVRDMGLYLLFFPQLIAGPIIKAHYFWPQLKAKMIASIHWGRAFRFLVTGYFFKMVIADNLKQATDLLTHTEFIEATSGAQLLILLLGYSMQIFADFCGYSMIAIGLATLFGYRFPINFNFPYISTSVSQFWRRWNITLSSWLRDYLYIPLGGNRKGSVRTYTNLFLVMFLGGLWHGADWKFALWGSLHGLFLALERLCRNNSALSRVKVPEWLAILYCFTVVTLLWSTSLMPDMATIHSFFVQVITHFSCPWAQLFTDTRVYSVVLFSSFIIWYHIRGWRKEHGSRRIGDKRFSRAEAVLYGLMIFMIITNAGPQSGFVYFQF